jgi:hypothetical protein
MDTRTHPCMFARIVANAYSFMKVFSYRCVCCNFINCEILFSTFFSAKIYGRLTLWLHLCNTSITMVVHLINWGGYYYIPFLPNMFISFHNRFQVNSHGSTALYGPRTPPCRGFETTLRRTTLGTTPLDEWSVRRRDLYLTTHNTHKRQTSLPPARLEHEIPASERPYTHALDRAATCIGQFTEITQAKNSVVYFIISNISNCT